ncbi:xanthine dehydrogenase [Bradyrhizobium sp. Ai1a-2]|uniref:xanthine dehydrogenase n=1 Tax=Bradyrhizobium sp. Ai1a-2 TaxID=196490 RepID=UPI0004137507|nr:xanthine dehydrogenase [Bradyrhizobium sp. Ai1a-2]
MKVAAIARHPREQRPFMLVLGTNEIASAIATKLTEATFAVVMKHDAFPPVMRRGMSFHDSLFGELCEIEGVVGERADTLREIARIHAEPHKVAVTELHLTEIVSLRSPLVIIDARMQKHRVTPDLRGVARLTVGVGPRFEVGINCDIAIETHPAETGAIISRGITKMADGRARELGHVGRERFAYSDRDGVWHTPLDIGTQVYKGLQLGSLGDKPVRAPVDGVLRGVVRDGSRVPARVKLLEIDPRGREACWTGMDERGRAIGSGVLTTLEKLMPANQVIGPLSANDYRGMFS